ncbi:MAG: hypothetical protein HY721_14355 [Planctomycetes bacterium]|nr:hypothetical protein [Planctomycetota bacterium]
MLGVAKRRIAHSIQELSAKAEFAIVYGGFPSARPEVPAALQTFPDHGRPVAALEPAKRGAEAFLAGAPVDRMAVLIDDFRAALRSAEDLAARRKVIVYVGPGYVHDQRYEEALREIRLRNTVGARIFPIGVSPYPEADQFLKALAAQNGGTYLRVD